jgi:hypothetical protein
LGPVSRSIFSGDRDLVVARLQLNGRDGPVGQSHRTAEAGGAFAAPVVDPIDAVEPAIVGGHATEAYKPATPAFSLRSHIEARSDPVAGPQSQALGLVEFRAVEHWRQVGRGRGLVGAAAGAQDKARDGLRHQGCRAIHLHLHHNPTFVQ